MRSVCCLSPCTNSPRPFCEKLREEKQSSSFTEGKARSCSKGSTLVGDVITCVSKKNRDVSAIESMQSAYDNYKKCRNGQGL